MNHKFNGSSYNVPDYDDNDDHHDKNYDDNDDITTSPVEPATMCQIGRRGWLLQSWTWRIPAGDRHCQKHGGQD